MNRPRIKMTKEEIETRARKFLVEYQYGHINQSHHWFDVEKDMDDFVAFLKRDPIGEFEKLRYVKKFELKEITEEGSS